MCGCGRHWHCMTGGYGSPGLENREGGLVVEHVHTSRVSGGLVATCTMFSSMILRIIRGQREHSGSLILTNPSEIEMSVEEETSQLLKEVIQAVEERILKKLQDQLGAKHKAKEGGR